MAVRIGHVKIAFSPGGVAWDFRIKSTFLQMSPESVHIRNVEDQPPQRVAASPIADCASLACSGENLVPSPP